MSGAELSLAAAAGHRTPRTLACALGAALLAAAGGVARAQAPSVQELGFDEALERFVSRSTGVAAQRANLDATKARGLTAYAAFAPSLSFDAKTSSSGGPQQATNNSNQIEATSSLNLLHWGADYEGLRAARLDADTQQALLDVAVLKAEDDGAQALLGEIEARLEVEALENLVRTRSDSLSIAQQRFKAGLLASQEVDMVFVDLENARSRHADAVVREAGARATLASQLGGASIRSEWPWKDRFFSGQMPAGPGTATGAAKDTELPALLSARPDWQAAEAKLSAEERRADRGWLLMLPSLDASAAYGYYGQNGYLYPNGTYNSWGWNAALTLSLPFFDHLATYSAARAQAYVRALAEAQLEQARRAALSEWESARDSYATAVGSAVRREKTLAVARKLYADNERRFQAGRINANDLAIDQGRVSDAEIFAAQGWSAAHLAYVRLCHARGVRLASCGASR